MFKLLFVNPLFLVVSSVAFVAGCASYTINQNPTVAVPITHFYQAGTANLEDQQEVNSEWWLSFNRESLNCLIQQALSDNLNVVEVVALRLVDEGRLGTELLAKLFGKEDGT